MAAAALVATPWLITPWPQNAPWYESPGAFPRFALVLVIAGALTELLARQDAERDADSDEMDASASRPVLMAVAVALFVAYSLATPVLGFLTSTLLFSLVTARAVRLPWRASVLLAVPLAVVLWLVFAKGLNIAFGGWL
nr:tripartite tricarboxylate transporter TctB family protein [Variovorax terrae]